MNDMEQIKAKANELKVCYEQACLHEHHIPVTPEWLNMIALLLAEVERLEGEYADCVPRSRYNCANDDWLKSEAKLAHVQEAARTEIERLEQKLAQAEARCERAVMVIDALRRMPTQADITRIIQQYDNEKPQEGEPTP